MGFQRGLRYQLPFMRGEDVMEVQEKLIQYGYGRAGQADGLFGPATEAAVEAFQADHQLKVDGIVGGYTWAALFADAPQELAEDKVLSVLAELQEEHGYRGSVSWQLTAKGLSIDGEPPLGTSGAPTTVARVWNDFRVAIETWGKNLGTPVELIIATICTETQGRPDAVREEPGYASDASTPDKVSLGLMQTLISTAREALADDTINRSWLLQPENSIRAGTAYIARQWRQTNFDPPKVACAYNAGSVRYNDSPDNRWKMAQYPIGSGAHADRFVQWFNDAFRFFDAQGLSPAPSFFDLLSRPEG